MEINELGENAPNSLPSPAMSESFRRQCGQLGAANQVRATLGIQYAVAVNLIRSRRGRRQQRNRLSTGIRLQERKRSE